MTNEMDLGQGASQADVTTEFQGGESQSYQQPAQVEDKRFTQAHLDRVAKKRAQEAYERGFREAQGLATNSDFQPRTAVHQGNQSRDEIERLVDERAAAKLKEMRQQEQMETRAAYEQQQYQQIAEKFISKIANAKETYPDFEEKVAALNLTAVAPIIPFITEVENTQDVLYDLASHPSKAANLLVLAERAPHLARQEAARMADAIRQNKEAAAQKQPKPPLSQVKPSFEGTDSGSMSIKELRSQSWLRG